MFILFFLFLYSKVICYDIEKVELGLANPLPLSHDESCKVVENGLYPNLWVQIAQGRTASTLQTATLILIAHRVCNRKGVRYHYVHLPNNKWKESIPRRLEIVKTHDLRVLTDIKPGSYIFSSVLDDDDEINAQKSLKSFNPNLAPFTVVQNLKELTNGTYGILNQRYAPIFNLTEKDMFELSTVLDLWSELRICCGQQMSSSWRKFLIKSDEEQKKLIEEVLPDVPHKCLLHNDNLRSVEEAYRAASFKYNLPLFEHGFYVGQCECSINYTHKYQINEMNHEMLQDCEYYLKGSKTP